MNPTIYFIFLLDSYGILWEGSNHNTRLTSITINIVSQNSNEYLPPHENSIVFLCFTLSLSLATILLILNSPLISFPTTITAPFRWCLTLCILSKEEIRQKGGHFPLLYTETLGQIPIHHLLWDLSKLLIFLCPSIKCWYNTNLNSC